MKKTEDTARPPILKALHQRVKAFAAKRGLKELEAYRQVILAGLKALK